jgi:hypothetical protein
MIAAGVGGDGGEMVDAGKLHGLLQKRPSICELYIGRRKDCR